MKKIIFLVFLTCGHSLLAQSNLEQINQQIDSLQKLAPSFGSDTLLIAAFNQKGIMLINSGFSADTALYYAQKALKLSEKHNWHFGKIYSWFTLTDIENVKSRYFSVVNYSLKVLTHADKNKDWCFYAPMLKSTGGALIWLEKPREAIKYYQQFFDEMKGKMNKKFTHQNLPNFALSSSLYNDALTDMGIIYTKKIKLPAKAIGYFKEAEQRYLNKKDTVGLGYFNSYYGLALEQINQHQNAREAFDKSISYLKKSNVEFLLADALNNASEYYFRQKKFEKATNLANEALYYANKGSIYYSLRDANQNLYEINQAKGNFKNALVFYKKYAAMRDSMSEANYEDKMKVIRYEFDTQKQQEEIRIKIIENKRQNTLIYSLLAGIFALGLLGFVGYRNINYRRRLAEKEIIQLQQEKQLVASQSLIKGQEKERSRVAKDLHDGLGGLLSGIKLTLNNMKGNVILTEEYANVFGKALGQLDNAIGEMRRVAHSMMPEALVRFGLVEALQDFCEGLNDSGQIEIDFQALNMKNRFESSVENTLYRIVQELLNNTIKHAEASHAQVQIAYNEDERMIHLTVEDNGKGFDTTKSTKGAGMHNVESRVAYLNGHLDIQSELGKGTSVEVIVAPPAPDGGAY